MSDNPFTVDLWNSFWEYTHGWVLVEKEKSHWDEYWKWVDLFENFWDIQQTEGSIWDHSMPSCECEQRASAPSVYLHSTKYRSLWT